MLKPDFSDAELKLQRAHKHIDEFETLIASCLSADQYRIFAETDNRQMRTETFLQSLHKHEKDFNVILGDALGNIRSALDYIAVAIVFAITGETKDTSFPFADNANGFKGTVEAQKHFGQADPTIQEHFINSVQAYEGGNGHAFWVVNKLRNIDKHRLLLTVVETLKMTTSFVDRNGNMFIDTSFGAGKGQKSTMISAPAGHVQFTKEPQVSYEIRFAEPGIIQGDAVLPFLKNARELSQALIGTLKIKFGI